MPKLGLLLDLVPTATVQHRPAHTAIILIIRAHRGSEASSVLVMDCVLASDSAVVPLVVAP
jgi:hypothetical protein